MTLNIRLLFESPLMLQGTAPQPQPNLLAIQAFYLFIYFQQINKGLEL